MSGGSWIFIANVAATLSMAGAIWVVQLAHYPAFHFVDANRFPVFERFHQQRITLIVVPLMLLEVLTAALLLWERPPELPSWAAWSGAALLGVIWLSTAVLQIPLHRELSRGMNKPAIERLIATNWIRTIAWTARGALMIWAVSRSLSNRA
jgi:hypothetical protein